MTKLEEARREYTEAGMALDAFSVIGGSEKGKEEAGKRYRKAIEVLKELDENFRKRYEEY